MKTLLVLYTVLLLGLGHCEHYDKDKDLIARVSTNGNLKGRLSGMDFYETPNGTSPEVQDVTSSSPTFTNEVILDIASPDSSSIDTFTSEDVRGGGICHGSCYVKDGVRVTSVVENGMPIWTSFKGERCLYVDTFTGDGGRIMSICTYADEKIDYLYYEYIGGAWKEITEEEFSKRYQGMTSPPKATVPSNTIIGVILDISSLSSFPCPSFDYYHDDIPMRIFFPCKVQIQGVVDGPVIILMPQPQERLEYVLFYLKNGQPEVVLVAKIKDSVTSLIWYARMGGKWELFESFNETLGLRISALRISTNSPTNFTIDLSSTHSSDHCIIFDVPLYGIDTRLFFPKNGHAAKEVRDGSAIIWTSSGEEKCLSCELYFGEVMRPLLLLVIKTGNGRISRHFEEDGGWKYIGFDCFSKKRNGSMDDDAVVNRGCFIMCMFSYLIEGIGWAARKVASVVRMNVWERSD